MTLKLQVTASTTQSHRQVLADLAPINLSNAGDDIHVTLNIGYGRSYVYPDQLLLVASAIHGALARGVTISGTCNCTATCEGYASRMNFFEYINIAFHESFIRRSSLGKFLEISKFPDFGTGNELVNEIMKIFVKQNLTNDAILQSLSLTLAELVSNVFDHSQIEEGWLVAQYYPKLSCIRLMIADTGIGIYKALTTNPKNEAYKQLSPLQAVERCVEKGVTNGVGCGNGLNITSNLITQSGGILSIYSGENYLSISEGNRTSGACPYWPGTVVFLQIDSRASVDVNVINGGSTDFVDQFNSDMDDWFA
ncbi:ATP-binding protein [Dyadobacter sp.]|uniref:ATP-binding protein n=1 Tax=Dyadobacter sp. TaxID=1914288 RepID=UPI003F722491